MYQKVTIMGRVGKDPETRYMPNGNAVVNLSVATSERWKDKESGEKMEKTEWHRVVFFGKVAEIAGEYLKKGNLVLLEGKLQTSKWEKDGVERYSTEIIADHLTLMPKAGESEERGGAKTDRRPASAKGKPAAKSEPADSGEFDDDIPF